MNRADKLAAGKFPLDAARVARMVARQFPQFSDLPVRPVAEDGWDNWTFHLGDRLKVRLPSAAGYSGQAEKEARWLPVLAPHLPFAVPVPVAIGAPEDDYPWAWTIYEWLEGETVGAGQASEGLAEDVARFLGALARIDPKGGPAPGQHCWWRGGSVMARYGADARRFVARLAGRIDAEGAMSLLDAAEAAPFTGTPQWVHGDVAAGNLLLVGGRLSAVIDFGGLSVGDPATDLVCSWVLFDGAPRAAFRTAVAADAGTWARARAWALWKAALVLADGLAQNPLERAPLAVIEDVIAEHRQITH